MAYRRKGSGKQQGREPAQMSRGDDCHRRQARNRKGSVVPSCRVWSRQNTDEPKKLEETQQPEHRGRYHVGTGCRHAMDTGARRSVAAGTGAEPARIHRQASTDANKDNRDLTPAEVGTAAHRRRRRSRTAACMGQTMPRPARPPPPYARPPRTAARRRVAPTREARVGGEEHPRRARAATHGPAGEKATVEEGEVRRAPDRI